MCFLIKSEYTLQTSRRYEFERKKKKKLNHSQDTHYTARYYYIMEQN